MAFNCKNRSQISFLDLSKLSFQNITGSFEKQHYYARETLNIYFGI